MKIYKRRIKRFIRKRLVIFAKGAVAILAGFLVIALPAIGVDILNFIFPGEYGWLVMLFVFTVIIVISAIFLDRREKC